MVTKGVPVATEFCLLRHLNVDNDEVHARHGPNGAIARFVYPSEVRLSNVNRVQTSGVEGGSADVTVTEMLSAGVRPQVQMRKLSVVAALVHAWYLPPSSFGGAFPGSGGGPILPFFQTRARKWEAVVLLAWLATAMESTRGHNVGTVLSLIPLWSRTWREFLDASARRRKYVEKQHHNSSTSRVDGKYV